jgi:uncharacterized protein YndB with AHSA1/START domain
MADIKHSIQISAKPEQIYPLVATAKGFGQWWAEDITEPTGAVELGFFKRATVYRLRLEADQPPTQVEWACETGDEWNSTRIAFQMEAIESGTLLRFTHAGWRAESDDFVLTRRTQMSYGKFSRSLWAGYEPSAKHSKSRRQTIPE